MGLKNMKNLPTMILMCEVLDYSFFYQGLVEEALISREIFFKFQKELLEVEKLYYLQDNRGNKPLARFYRDNYWSLIFKMNKAEEKWRRSRELSVEFEEKL